MISDFVVKLINITHMGDKSNSLIELSSISKLIDLKE